MENNDFKLLEENRKMPKDVKEQIITKIFKNLVVALILMSFLFLINITYYMLNDKFEYLLKYYSCIVSVISVILLEISYNKKSLFFCIIGFEFLGCSLLSLFIPYIYLHTNSYLRNIVIMLPAILVVYYFIKSFIIFKKESIDFKNSLCDIKEILKSDKKSYLDEKSEKVYKKKLKEEEKIKNDIKKEQEIRKKVKKNKK